jgi:hypothetical protein
MRRSVKKLTTSSLLSELTSKAQPLLLPKMDNSYAERLVGSWLENVSIHRRLPRSRKTIPMWETFWPDVLVAVIGALLTVVIAYGTFLIQQARQEKQVLRGLINDLHHRRALAITRPQEIPNAVHGKDFQRASLSVIDIRDHIRRVRDQVRQDRATVDVLSDMIRACNRYLEESEGTPDFYAFLLKTLSEDLNDGVDEISRIARGVRALQPGSSAV